MRDRKMPTGVIRWADEKPQRLWVLLARFFSEWGGEDEF
jgi:hypothetical protein